MTPRIAVMVLHAAFDEGRKRGLERVRAGLDRSLVEVVEYHDFGAQGSLRPYLALLSRALETTKATHFTFVPDDARLPRMFTRALLSAVEAMPAEVLCFQMNHVKLARLSNLQRLEALGGSPWYTTTDGFTNFGGTMSRALLEDFLAWRKRELKFPLLDARQHVHGCNADESVNLWCMATGRYVVKSAVTIVGHDLDAPSLDGHDEQTQLKLCLRDDERAPSDVTDLTCVERWQVPATPGDSPLEARSPTGWSRPPAPFLGATYASKECFRLISKLQHPMPRRAYQLHQDLHMRGVS